MACISCGRGILDECACEVSESLETAKFINRRREGRIGISAGRKRAAADYPLKENMPCEWRNMANCGGGRSPIVGCVSGLQKNRHHGPDKDTANNEEGNVHRICPHCHNRWHAANDPDYVVVEGISTFKYELADCLHDPRPASVEELAFRVTETG